MMLITNLLVAGSVAYASVKTVTKPAHRKQLPQTATIAQRASQAGTAATPTVVSSVDEAPVPTLAERRHHAVAATSFWLAMGGLLFPPLTLASIPLTIYSTVPILEAGCRSLYEEGRLKPSVINSILIVSTLLTDHYLPAATLTWLHHTFRQIGRQLQTVGEQMTTDLTHELGDLAHQVMGGAPRQVWVVDENIEVKMPFTQVKVGDVVVVNRGEFVPVDGVITVGEATVNLVLRTGNATPVVVRAGDPVSTSAFVTEGRIRVRVEQIPRRADA
jgi:cation transport ATPase